MASRPDRELFLVTVVARPRHDNSESTKVGGAYVNCWIDEPSEVSAVARAEAEVREADWIPESIQKIVVVTRKDYESHEDGREYFEQALIDGVVLVFHTFPNEAAEDEAMH
jgi:hypothetical protein